MNDGTVSTSNFCNLGARLKGAYLVVGSLHRHQQRAIVDCRFGVSYRDPALVVNRQHNKLVTFFLELLAGEQDSLVFDGGGDDPRAPAVAIGATQTQNRKVIALRGAHGKNQLPGLAADQPPPASSASSTTRAALRP